MVYYTILYPMQDNENYIYVCRIIQILKKNITSNKSMLATGFILSILLCYLYCFFPCFWTNLMVPWKRGINRSQPVTNSSHQVMPLHTSDAIRGVKPLSFITRLYISHLEFF